MVSSSFDVHTLELKESPWANYGFDQTKNRKETFFFLFISDVYTEFIDGQMQTANIELVSNSSIHFYFFLFKLLNWDSACVCLCVGINTIDNQRKFDKSKFIYNEIELFNGKNKTPWRYDGNGFFSFLSLSIEVVSKKEFPSRFQQHRIYFNEFNLKTRRRIKKTFP